VREGAVCTDSEITTYV